MARRKITLSTSLPKPAPPPDKGDPWAEAPDTDEEAVRNAMNSPFRQAAVERLQRGRERAQQRRAYDPRLEPNVLAEQLREMELGSLFQDSLSCSECRGYGFVLRENVRTSSGNELPPFGAPCPSDNCAIGSIVRLLWQLRRQVSGR